MLIVYCIAYIVYSLDKFFWSYEFKSILSDCKVVKEMATELLSFNEGKIILKWHWQFKNIWDVQRQWLCAFATEPRTRLTTVLIKDTFGANGMVHVVHKHIWGGLAQQRVTTPLLLRWNSLHDPETMCKCDRNWRIKNICFQRDGAHNIATAETSEYISMKPYLANG